MTQNSVESLLPENTYDLVSSWLLPYACAVKLSRPRSTKFGDFRPASSARPATITINADLPPLQMLLTLTHEIAHLEAWEAHGRSIQPHGTEWKACFATLLHELATLGTLPSTFRAALKLHAVDPRSSSVLDSQLYVVLRTLERPGERALDTLPLGDSFRFRGRTYRKLSSQRTRCTCLDIASNQKVRISMMAPIEPV